MNEVEIRRDSETTEVKFNAEKRVEEALYHINQRTKMDLLRDHTVEIRTVSRGCIVRVGCKEVAFSSLEEGLKEVQDFYSDPHKSYTKWTRIFEGL
jgi:hypothetical protein